MLISVTQEDIDNGKQGCGRQCPIALAVARAFPNSTIHVGAGIAVGVIINDVVYPPMAQLKAFIYAFDTGHGVKPFTFELAV